MIRTLRTALLAALLPLCQCSTGEPSLQRVLEIQPGDQVRVLHADRQANLTIGLQNASLGTRERVYSQGGDPSFKIVDDAQLQVLLDVLADQGFFRRALDTERPEARAVLAVQRNGRNWVWSRLPLGQDRAEDIEEFYRCVAYVQALYNQTTAFYSRQMTADDFEREKQAVEGRSQEALETLKTRKNPPQ